MFFFIGPNITLTDTRFFSIYEEKIGITFNFSVFSLSSKKVEYWAVIHRSSAYMNLLVPSCMADH